MLKLFMQKSFCAGEKEFRRYFKEQLIMGGAATKQSSGQIQAKPPAREEQMAWISGKWALFT